MQSSALNKIRRRVFGRCTVDASFVGRLALFNAAMFFIGGVYLPYMPLWLGSRGLSNEEIAVVIACPQILRIGFTPLIAYSADCSGDLRFIVRMLCLALLVALAALAYSRSFMQILAFFFIFAISWSTIIPLTEVVAMKGVRERGHNYGRMRLWGSLSFIVASTGCGFAIQAWGTQAMIVGVVAAGIGVTAASLALPGDQPSGAPTVEKPAGWRPAPDNHREEIFSILGSPVFWLFVASASSVQAAHGFYYTFASIHWQSQHIPGSVIGALWTLGVIAEIVFFAYSGRLMMRFSPSRLIFIGALAAIVRWAAMAFDPPLALLAPLQLLHAFTFGAAHLGAVHFISEAAPQRVAATAQAIYASISSGIVTGAVILASGPLYHAYGGAGYGVMALLALFSAGAAFQLDRLWRRGFLAPDQRYLLAPPHKVGDKSV